MGQGQTKFDLEQLEAGGFLKLEASAVKAASQINQQVQRKRPNNNVISTRNSDGKKVSDGLAVGHVAS